MPGQHHPDTKSFSLYLLKTLLTQLEAEAGRLQTNKSDLASDLLDREIAILVLTGESLRLGVSRLTLLASAGIVDARLMDLKRRAKETRLMEAVPLPPTEAVAVSKRGTESTGKHPVTGRVSKPVLFAQPFRVGKSKRHPGQVKAPPGEAIGNPPPHPRQNLRKAKARVSTNRDDRSVEDALLLSGAKA